MPAMGPPTGKRTVSESGVSDDAIDMETEDKPKRPKIATEGADSAVDSGEDSAVEEEGDDDDEDGDDGQESDGKQEYKILGDDDVEGQEDGTVKVDDGVRITPFNIQEELEEGHFDTDGNFYVDKDKGVKDAWLEGLDQFADEDYEKLRKKKADEAAAEDAAAPAAQSDSELYKIILGLLRPGESIGKALRRLGAGIKPTQRVKKGGLSAAAATAVDPVKKEFDALTAAADAILGKGNLEIYQETFEKIQHKLSKDDARLKGLAVDAEADIFGEDFDAKKVSQPKADEEEDSANQTLWEYKWENTETADIHGPYSSEQMIDWVQQDFFKDGVFVRKAGVVDAPFYTSKRVDFELYV
ncbi:putative CD2 antigen cytoplasmic tail-binding protein 2 [Hypsibius exemplaris]|uniref:CD2 antigen cytoplasmic tail-binding protein 2 n=1 Tax=Hypsibius exemplaris TaxID=2072580 RepID=A0A1W0WLV4_HYPEX|nr:putative CD2 antigen cytoplasmic tail-binding protein 2 [Hypsibius exemplaris]